ncbi:MAG: hypothetical protein WCJ35_05585 [Planctomycetota bacterium]
MYYPEDQEYRVEHDSPPGFGVGRKIADNSHHTARTGNREAAPPPDHQHDSTSYQVTAMPVFYKNRV